MTKKTYILTENELAFFLGLTDMQPNGFSPEIFAQIRLDSGDFPGSLVAKGLIVPEGEGFSYTGDGKILVNALLRPKSAAEIEKRSEKACFYLFTSGGAYVLFNVITDGRCMAVIFPDAEQMEQLLDKCFLNKELKYESFSVQLGYDEWFMFLLTQFFFMQRQAALKRPLSDSEMWADVAQLDMPKVRQALKASVPEGGIGAAVTDRLEQENVRRDVCRRLEDLGLLITEESDGTMAVKYTENAVKWLDNDRSAELITVTSLRTVGSRRIMYTVRENGLVSLEQTASGVKIATCEGIKWREFL